MMICLVLCGLQLSVPVAKPDLVASAMSRVIHSDLHQERFIAKPDDFVTMCLQTIERVSNLCSPVPHSTTTIPIVLTHCLSCSCV